MQSTQGRALIFGTIYTLKYSNWKRDPSPLILVMYSGQRSFVHVSGHYTDGINLHYLRLGDKMWLSRMIYLMKKGNQIMKPHLFYRFVKLNRPNIIRTAFRRYHTSMINRPKMVSAGWTSLTKLVYPFNDSFITGLNKTLEPAELGYTKIQVAYNKTEIADRINQTLNSKSISGLRTSTSPATGASTTPTV
jgi:hypothetical protein